MDSDELRLACSAADAAPDLAAAVRELRSLFPALRVSSVDAFDMRDEIAVASGRLRRLWLGTNDGVCWRITTIPLEATAIFIADAAVS
jgi:hypothetical protein